VKTEQGAYQNSTSTRMHFRTHVREEHGDKPGLNSCTKYAECMIEHDATVGQLLKAVGDPRPSHPVQDAAEALRHDDALQAECRGHGGTLGHPDIVCELSPRCTQLCVYLLLLLLYVVPNTKLQRVKSQNPALRDDTGRLGAGRACGPSGERETGG
jgi:hypothetical protein